MLGNKAALYRVDGRLVKSYYSLRELGIDNGISYGKVYQSAYRGTWLKGNIGFVRLFDNQPEPYIDPQKVKPFGYRKKKENPKTAKTILPQGFRTVTDEMILNTKMVKTFLKSIERTLEEIGGVQIKRIMNQVMLLHHESVMLGIIAERNGKGKELEEQIWQQKRK